MHSSYWPTVIFCGNSDTLFQYCLMNQVKNVFEIEIFYNIINIFTAKLDEFESLLNKSINFFQKK